MSDNAHGDNLI